MLVRTMSPGERIVLKIPASSVEQTVEVLAVAIRSSKKMRIGIAARREIRIERVEPVAEKSA